MKSILRERCRKLAGLLMMAGLAVPSFGQTARFAITENKAAKRIDITVDGKPFTSYIYPDSLMKPVLYPIRAADGAFITRGWPLVPRAGEPVDHPHHIGLWFNYENVNGLDFWNNSSSIPPGKKKNYGNIRHFSVDKMVATDKGAELDVTSYWDKWDGTKLIKQNTKYVFGGSGEDRWITLIVKLTALNEGVAFRDTKDGLIGLRLARELEQPSDDSEKVTDAKSNITGGKEHNKNVATGRYRSSEGIEGDAVWGTRARWVNLKGRLNGRPVSVVMLDYPGNVGYPTYWHARGYGLFAANPLGQKVFSKGAKDLEFKLNAGASVIFRYKVLIQSGSYMSDRQVNRAANSFDSGAN